MQTAKNWFGLIGALIPVLFFGGMFLYFGGVNDASYGLFDSALGPTRLGLGALTGFFLLLFLWRLSRLSRPPSAPKTVGRADAEIEEGKSDFDADAAMARYLARRNGDTSVPRGAGFTPPADRPPPGSFGRKGNFQ